MLLLEVVLKECQRSSQVSRTKLQLGGEDIISYIRNRLEAAWLAQKVATGEQRTDEVELEPEANDQHLSEIKIRYGCIDPS